MKITTSLNKSDKAELKSGGTRPLKTRLQSGQGKPVQRNDSQALSIL